MRLLSWSLDWEVFRTVTSPCYHYMLKWSTGCNWYIISQCSSWSDCRCTGWSGAVLSLYNLNPYKHDTAHIQIAESVARTSRDWPDGVASRLYLLDSTQRCALLTNWSPSVIDNTNTSYWLVIFISSRPAKVKRQLPYTACSWLKVNAMFHNIIYEHHHCQSQALPIPLLH